MMLVLSVLIACSGSEEPASSTSSAVAPVEAPKADAAPDAIPAPADVAAAPADAIRTPSGLAYKVLTPGGGGDHPGATDRVTVHYVGWTTDGKMFDSSYKRKKPASFALNKVIAGWTEGVQLMAVGEKTRFWIPEELAYKGTPGKPAGMLVFDVELVDVLATPKVPEDVAAPSAGATTSKSGLASKVLKAGTGTEHPSPTSQVRVHYTGWTKDGKEFDSSVRRGQPASFPLDGVIGGWTEGLQLMVVGERRRFWIPAELAYGETPKRPGAPAGQLTFDVELLEIGGPQER